MGGEPGIDGTFTDTSHIYFAGKRIARRDVVTNNVHYMFSDHLGSTSLVTDALGTMAACNGYVSGQFESDYYPYGGEMPICNNVGDQNYKFTGKERDAETGLDYFTARFDTSSLGRFMSADPMLGHLGDPQSLNKYAYVENNPATLTDPTGLDPSFNSLASDMTPNTWGGQASEWCQQVKAFEGARALLEAMAQMGEAQAWNSAVNALWLAGGSSGEVMSGSAIMDAAQNQAGTLSQKGLKFIAKHEGFRKKVYRDIYGNETIGYGHLLKPGERSKFKNGISKKQALSLLQDDVQNAVSFVNRHLDMSVSQNAFDALVDTAFNSPRAAGIVINKINNEEPIWSSTFRETLPHGYNSPPGLLRRRDDEGTLYLTGQY